MSKKSLGIFVPCYNEENRLPINEFTSFVENKINEDNYTIIFLNDGSSDNTSKILTDLVNLFPNKLKVSNYVVNAGKAETVRKGILEYQNSFDLFGYLDADLATGIEEFYEIGLLALKRQKNICFGSRIKKLGSEIDRKRKRHIIGRVFSTLANGIIQVPVYDTQCGAKYFDKSLISIAFDQPFISKWLFDIEVICRILSSKGKHYFLENAVEVPLRRWKEKGESKIKLIDFFNFPLELMRIKRKYKSQIKD